MESVFPAWTPTAITATAMEFASAASVFTISIPTAPAFPAGLVLPTPAATVMIATKAQEHALLAPPTTT